MGCVGHSIYFWFRHYSHDQSFNGLFHSVHCLDEGSFGIANCHLPNLLFYGMRLLMYGACMIL